MYLGIDVGTSGTKAVLLAGDGDIIATATAPHTLSTPEPGWSEQDPVVWWEAVVSATRQVCERCDEPVRAIGLSGQMHGSVFLDQDALSGAEVGGVRALRPALLWNDQRTAHQCEQIERAIGGRRRLVEAVGNAALTGFTLPKVVWCRDHEAELFQRVAGLCLPKDFVRLQMTGRFATDVGDASGMLCLDVSQRVWNRDVLEQLDVASSLLPELLESGEIAGHVTKWAAEQLGIPAGVPVVAGSGDNQMGAIGAGVVQSGMVLATLGTSGVIYAHSDAPRLDLGDQSGRVHTMCAANGSAHQRGDWCITGCMLSAAGSLEWARRTVAPECSFKELIDQAAALPTGAEGLIFLPYLTGERCPYPDPEARGGWIGLTSRHTRAHLIRAVIEGVTLGMSQILRLVHELPVSIDVVRLGGGGAKSEMWRQLQADIYGIPVALTNTEEGPAFGAALLAAVAGGHFDSVQEACDAVIRVTELREPQSQFPMAIAEAFDEGYSAVAGLAQRLGSE